MSAKWVRSQQWDDRFFPPWAAPAKFILRAFSSVRLAILLLLGVAIYGTLASVPLGMLAGIPTWLIYIASLLAAVALLSVLPTWLLVRALARREQPGASPAPRFIAGVAAFLLTTALAWTLWYSFAWPHLRYDPVSGSGLKLFRAFCDEHARTMVRHLPGVEMSELEFYAWWPIKVLLLAFVANLTIATLRRIEFKFMNLGVLTVHSGIITIAIGSVYYGALKQEGDMFLMAGAPAEGESTPSIGRPASGFFANPELMDPVLWVRQSGKPDEWEQRPIAGLPRYNDYNLDAAAPALAGAARRASDRGRTLSIPVPPPPIPPALRRPGAGLDDDIRLRVVGFACYGETRETWVDATGIGGSTPVRHIELLGTDGKIVADYLLAPGIPGDRAITSERFLGVEYLEDPDPAYWQALQTVLPPEPEAPASPAEAPGPRHGLILELPALTPDAAPQRLVVSTRPGATHQFAGWTITVKELHPEPPISIITPGYQGATSPVAILRVDPPRPAAGAPAAPYFDRYVYARFPELNQDLLDETTEGGMPKRRAAAGDLRITYIDAALTSIVIAAGKDGVGPLRAITRLTGRNPTLIENIAEGQIIQLVPMLSARIGKRVAGAELIDAPWPVPESRRDRDMLRTRRASQLALEVSTVDREGRTNWSTVLWVQNNPWHPVETDDSLFKSVPLPDGRTVQVAYGRRYQPFPGFQVALVDFEMTPYPHTMTPKDYRSDLRVTRLAPGEGGRLGAVSEQRSTSMNNPLLLRVPFQPDPSRPAFANFASWIVSWIAPTQYKLSQNSWDAEGWNRSKSLADAGELPRPYARYTIIGVGNNPGIYIIATGAVMMAVGIPWAFYVKPWLLRREKTRLAALVAAGKLTAPSGASAVAAPGRNGDAHHAPEPRPTLPTPEFPSKTPHPSHSGARR
ncbi:MAG: hypothetical protein AB7K52_12590 [Phycisphaerales bacterium]